MTPSYPTDLSDAQWEILEPLLPKARPGGRPRSVNLRRVIDAILYVLSSGGAWRLLPHDFPKWKTVYHYFRQWRNEGIWQQVHERLRQWVRAVECDRPPSPSAGVIDSQSVKTGTMVSREVGYDGGKKVRGRQRPRTTFSTRTWGKFTNSSIKKFIFLFSYIGITVIHFLPQTRKTLIP